MRGVSTLGVFLALAAAVAGASDAAWSKAKREKGEDGPVTAHSRYGHGSITAPTRKARFGQEVRLPGGTWIACRANCARTLREETIDFWEEQDKFRGGNQQR